MNSQWTQNSILASVIFLCGLVGGLLPLVCFRGASSGLRIGSAFGGGVFIGAGFIHLLPDASATLDADDGYPLASLISSSTAVIILLVEALATVSQPATTPSRPLTVTDPLVFQRDADAPLVEALEFPSESPLWAEYGSADTAAAFAQPWTTATLFLGLSFHSLLAGLSLGVLDDDVTSVFVAIVAHKSVAAFALGASMIRCRLARRVVLCWMLLFALVTPAGVMLGTAISGFADSSTAAAFKAIAAGTFVYVGLVEIGSKEFSQPVPAEQRQGCMHISFSMALALGAGYATMAVLACWV